MRDLFDANLHDIYVDIYVLNNMGFSGEYVERMTSLERDVYKLYKKIETAEAENKENEDTLTDMGIDPDALL